ncbi:MAG: MoxR family ATPase [Bacteroidota bacterium]
MAINIRPSINIRPKAKQYIMDSALERAVETALLFNQPLLLTGEPGTGKTQLAYRVAHDLAEQTQNKTSGPIFNKEPERFNTKTTTAARDLFYIYDAVGHFQSANIKREAKAAGKQTKDFIELQALGKAIALSNPQAGFTTKFKWDSTTSPQSSVVLIDEIDKAPRDFTNDLLNELERYEFFIKEQDNFRVKMDGANEQRILVIMTSNSEKNLPDAFLRRCVFYHIPFPKGDKMRDILESQLKNAIGDQERTNLEAIQQVFNEIRQAAVRKKPATAELVSFVRALEMDGLLQQPKPKIKDWYLDNLSLIIKTNEDLKVIKDFLQKA